MKKDLRRALLARRRASTTTDAAGPVLAELTSLVRQTAPTVIAAYVPVGAEPGGPGLPEALATASPGGRLLLPVLRADLDLDWAVYHGPDSLSPAPRGLREPNGERLGPDAVTAATLVVVPAVAVDLTGARLGRGGGSYDRALARVGTDALIVALLHDGELSETPLPVEAHDRRVHAVITPSGGLVTLIRP